MNTRDELAKVIVSAYGEDAEKECPREQDLDVADAILKAGYRKPRTITTLEELEALGHGSVIRSEQRHYWVAHKEDGMGADQGWAIAGGGAITSRELTQWLPATVLHEP